MNSPNRMGEILDQGPPAPAEIGYDAATAAVAGEEDRAMRTGTLTAAMNIGTVAEDEFLVPKRYMRGA